MIKLDHITLQAEDATYLLQDVSFSLEHDAFVSLHGNDARMHVHLARVLAGLEKPAKGTLTYEDRCIEAFEEAECGQYRASFAASLFSDFQLLEQRSVLENIVLASAVDEEELDNLLKVWGLYGKKETYIEDLDFEDHAKLVLVRIQLRHPHALIVHPQSAPFSQQEWAKMYPLLKKLSERLQVIVVGDSACDTYAQRILEFEDGYLITDSGSEADPGLPVLKKEFALDEDMKKKLAASLHQRFRWKYLLLTLLIILSLTSLTTALFSTTLDVTEIQMLYLKKNHYTTIAIEKHAQGKDQTLYDQKYDRIQEKDVTALQKALKGDVFVSYVPQNTHIVDSVRYGSDVSDFAAIELKDAKAAGFTRLYGEYPKTIYEVALPYNVVVSIFQKTYGVQPIEFYLYQTISWNGNLLKITGILDNAQGNKNLQMSMSGYSNQLAETSSLGQKSIYVVPGFHKEIPLHAQLVYRDSYKRLIDEQTSRSYSFEQLYPIPYANYYYYYNGKDFVLDNDGQGHSTIGKDEVLLSFSMALQLGYQSRYIRGYQQNEIDWNDREADYCAFIRNWIGKKITIQTYRIDDAPDNSTIMEKTVTIKGFLFPTTWDYEPTYVDSEGYVLMNQAVLKPYMNSNTKIAQMYYHSEQEKDMKQALSYLNTHPRYSAFFSKSLLLKFFVVDLKELNTLLSFTGAISLILAGILFYLLLFRSMEIKEKEMTVYYLFGESKQQLKQFYIEYMGSVLKRRILLGMLASLAILSVFVGMIYWKLSSRMTMFLNLLWPLVLSFLLFWLFVLSMRFVMKKRNVVEAVVLDEKQEDV